MFAIGNRISSVPTEFYRQPSPQQHQRQQLKKEELLYQRRQAIQNGFASSSSSSSASSSERNGYRNGFSSPSQQPISALRGSSEGGSTNSAPKSVTWKLNGMSSSSSTKSSPGSWSSLKETTKDVWENRMKESAELLKLYKHGYPADFNQNVFPGAEGGGPGGGGGPLQQLNSKQQNGYSEHPSKAERDKIYLNINLQKDKINYEPLSKTSKNSNNSSPSSQHNQRHSPPSNGYRSNAGILISTEGESNNNKKKPFSVDNIIDRQLIDHRNIMERSIIERNFIIDRNNSAAAAMERVVNGKGQHPSPSDDPNFRVPYENAKNRLKSAYRSNSITNQSDRIDSFKNGGGGGYVRSAFSPPHTNPRYLPLKSTDRQTDYPQSKSPEYPNTALMKPSGEYIGGGPSNGPSGNSPNETKMTVVTSPKETKSIHELQQQYNNGASSSMHGDNKTNSVSTNGHHATEFALPFKIKMKRSLAIYLGVDPEIDTVQYEPLNKNNARHGRHVFSSQHSRVSEIAAHKDDREMRIQSKKKSVYSCGYDVNSINIMLQNAKKRFKCSES